MHLHKTTFMLLFVLVLCVSPVLGAEITDTLEEGASQTYYLDEIGHFVDVIIIEDNIPASVYLKVNGEMTPELFEEDFYSFENAARIYIEDIFLDEGGESGTDEVTFTLSTDHDTGDFLWILDLEVDINDFMNLHIDEYDKLEVHPGDDLRFEVEIKNFFEEDDLFIHNVTGIFSCEDETYFTPAPIRVVFGTIPPEYHDAMALEETHVVETAPAGFTTDCEMTVVGTDIFSISRNDTLKFEIRIEEGPGIGEEVCHDNIDNDFDELTDCEDYEDCNGVCFEQLKNENRELRKQLQALETETNTLKKIVSTLENNVQRLICAIFECKEK